jgi:hypothetical protein
MQGKRSIKSIFAEEATIYFPNIKSDLEITSPTLLGNNY